MNKGRTKGSECKKSQAEGFIVFGCVCNAHFIPLEQNPSDYSEPSQIRMSVGEEGSVVSVCG